MRLGQIIRYWGDGVGTRNAQNKAIKVNIYEFEGMTVVSTTSKEHSKCLKSPTRLLNRVCVGRRGLDLSKEVLWVSVQLRAKQTAPLVERKDVSFILTIFPQNFWNK